ncbi:MAG: hypothetical protein ACREMS_07745 [Gemmatimonadaceae bacterium]
MTHYARLLLYSIAVASLAACVGDPVDWSDVSYRNPAPNDPGARRPAPAPSLPTIASTTGNCLASVSTVAGGSNVFRAWWASRSDSSVILSMEHSNDRGATWLPPVEVDARDRGSRGCKRPPAGVFYDSARKYLHVVYFIETTYGGGIFFAHSMDNGTMFHSPVPVIYGNHPSAASVAANGDSVVVVFEDPNATAPMLGIVLSRTTGHIFEARGEATPEDVPAAAPWVALDHRRITLWWKEAADVEGKTENRVGYRVGIWK